MTEVAYRRGCDMQRIPGDTAGDRVGLYKNCRVVYLKGVTTNGCDTSGCKGTFAATIPDRRGDDNK